MDDLKHDHCHCQPSLPCPALPCRALPKPSPAKPPLPSLPCPVRSTSIAELMAWTLGFLRTMLGSFTKPTSLTITDGLSSTKSYSCARATKQNKTKQGREGKGRTGKAMPHVSEGFLFADCYIMSRKKRWCRTGNTQQRAACPAYLLRADEEGGHGAVGEHALLGVVDDTLLQQRQRAVGEHLRVQTLTDTSSEAGRKSFITTCNAIPCIRMHACGIACVPSPCGR